MAIEDDHGLHGLDHQNSEFMSPQINDEDPLKQVNHEDDPLSSLRPKSTSGRSSSDSDEDGRSKRARSSPESNSEERELLGLTLNKTPSFVNLIETQLSEGKSSSSSSSPCPPRKVGRPPTRKNANKSKTDDFAISSEKLKASNFPARKLQVGDWERISKHEGDLIAKYYYAKRKLVWEILDGPLKNKIEIQWSDIIAIRAITPKGDHPGVLEIELNEPPILYRETNPQPRKHTLWQQSADFTGGQVGIHRRHCVTFPPGILDKHYEKLLGFDSRLNELSKKPYPSILCPYFPSYNPHEVSDFPFDSVYGSPLFPKKLNNPFYFSPALLPNRRLPNKSAMAAIPLRQFSSSFPISGERRSNFANINQRRALWGGQGSNNSLMNVTMGNQTNGMLLDQGSNNSLMTVALGNQTSGMLLDQGSNNSLMNVAMGNQTSGMLLDQGSNNSLMTVALGNQTNGMLGGQGSDNSLMNVALGNQTSGMLLDQGSDNSLMTVVMECRQTIEMLCNQGSSNNLMNVALGNQTSGMLGDQGSNNNLMNAAMENQTIGMLRDQGSNNSLMNVAMGNQTSGMLHSSSTTPQADWVVPTQDDHQQNNSLPNNEFISVLDFMTNHLLNENNQVASSSNENLDSMYPLLEHQGNESLVAASDMHDLYSGYQTVSNYAENVVPDYGMTYAEPLTWMYPEETSEILGLGQTMESLLADPYYQTLDANQGIRKSGNVISKRTELSFYINNIVSNDHKQIEVSGSSLGYGENPIRSATPEWALQCAIRISRVWRSKATRMSMHLKPSSMFSLTVNQHASYGKLLDILWVSNTKANHAGITMTLKLAMAAHFAVKWLKARGYKSCVVEMDSLLIVNMMQIRASHNMNLRPIVEDTTRLIVSNEITFSHCYREANMVSDFLAKLAASSGESVLYTDFGQLPAGAKGAYFLDKSQLPNLRIRYDKANFFVR
ncbi:putative GDSL esterase/lipase-like [Capsicum annuum]|nr:putative GDSL esterase/lipase-like [Capsicum annuum]